MCKHVFVTVKNIYLCELHFNSRSAIEGEQILKSKQIVLCGKIEMASVTQISALIVQTSHLQDMPHSIFGELTKPEVEIIKFKCSCKAGASECCKHVVAILLFLNRNSVADLEIFSSTDITFQWSKLKEPTLTHYKPLPIDTFDCYKKNVVDSNSVDDDADTIRSRFIAAAPTSAIALHSLGRHLPTNQSSVILAENTQLSRLNVSSHPLSVYLQNYPVMNMGDCCKHRRQVSKNLMVLYRSQKDKSFWDHCRQYRTTGSRYYGLYTFNKTFKTDEQWALKASRYFWPKLFTNKFVKYGLQYENIARDLYSKEFNTNILECGLVIDVNNPWLGYSPDGVIIDEYFLPIKIIEIKCPFDGKKLGIKDLLNSLKYIVKHPNGSLSLKKPHCYYAQVQMGIVLLNVKECDFIVHSSYENKNAVLKVIYDEDYCKNLFGSLKVIYFERLIHEVGMYN
ncbi:unnamed protein product [Macrosiphum euphorbiae]|uniref:SWIM-type domain-containing protein n=1 Tax=Macrosiphum euphorbiae TaxID=13131 RepID=A0AAV0Y957_9HEMI|nr:unnamed protein product [Macrosiphum euphorbiae]